MRPFKFNLRDRVIIKNYDYYPRQFILKRKHISRDEWYYVGEKLLPNGFGGEWISGDKLRLADKKRKEG